MYGCQFKFNTCNTVSAAALVLNNFVATVDNGMHCAVLFTNLLKAFATVDHFALLNK